MSFILGLTGSIGMGKSTTAAMFRARGVPVHDADAAVHALYAGAAVEPVEAAFPGVAVDGRIDRKRLAGMVGGNPEAMRRLEAIVHPLVHEAERAFLKRHGAAPLVVLDIPLLFETGGERRCHAVAVVSAAPEIQRARVLARPGMTEALFEQLTARQMSDDEKRRRAHVVIDSGRGLDEARAEVDALIRALGGPAQAGGPKRGEAGDA